MVYTSSSIFLEDYNLLENHPLGIENSLKLYTSLFVNSTNPSRVTELLVKTVLIRNNGKIGIGKGDKRSQGVA